MTLAEPKTVSASVWLHLDAIDPNPYQTRGHYRDIDVLAADIADLTTTMPETNGLLQLPAVRRHNGRYQLVHGHRRWQAFCFLAQQDGNARYGQMPVRVVQASDEQMLRLAWAENEQRMDLSAAERSDMIMHARRMHDSLAEVARMLGISRSRCSSLYHLQNAPPALLEANRRGIISDAVTEEAAIVAKLPDHVPWCNNSTAWKYHVRQWRLTVKHPFARPSAVIDDVISGSDCSRADLRAYAQLYESRREHHQLPKETLSRTDKKRPTNKPAALAAFALGVVVLRDLELVQADTEHDVLLHSIGKVALDDLTAAREIVTDRAQWANERLGETPAGLTRAHELLTGWAALHAPHPTTD